MGLIKHYDKIQIGNPETFITTIGSPEQLAFEDPIAGTVLLNELSSKIEFFEATVGTGGQYTTIAAAVAAGKYLLKMVGDCTDGAIGVSINDHVIVIGNNLHTLTLTIGNSLANILFLRCKVNVTGLGVNGDLEFQKCEIEFNGGYFGSSDTNIVESNIQHNAGLGIYTASAISCSITIASILYATGLTNCRLFGNHTIYNAYMVNCISTATLNLGQVHITNSYLINSNVFMNIAGIQVTNSTINNISNFNNEGSLVSNNIINGTVTFTATGQYNKLTNNNIAGVVTLNSGAGFNLIQGNTLSGGFTDNSGETTNIIKDNF